jgi:Fe-S cluster assembly protein SufD
MTKFADEFRRVEGELPGAGLPWLARLRRDAIERFEARGLPTPDWEDWRFTDVAPIAEAPLARAKSAGTAPIPGVTDGPLRSCQLVFIDGRYAPSLSRPPAGVTAGSLAALLPTLQDRFADGRAHPFVALNTAFAEDGAVVIVPKGVDVEAPIHLLFVARAAGLASHPRSIVVVGENASASIVESHVGLDGAAWTNAVADAVVGDRAILEWHVLQRQSREAFHTSSLFARIGRDGVFTSRIISVGAALARSEVSAVLDGEGAEATLDGLYEATGRQHLDHQTSIDHAAPRGTSRELYKGVLDGASRAVFNGRILVRPGAQKTDAIQTNRNLLLSKDALVDTKPQLEIFASDVKCKHGATVGQMDRDVLFYLRSRGIGLEAARRLLVHAFASEILDRVKHDAVRAQLGGCLSTMVAAEAGFET